MTNPTAALDAASMAATEKDVSLPDARPDVAAIEAVESAPAAGEWE
jgi:hypothetical protein